MLIPSFLTGPDIIVPIKIDLAYRGARLVDTFCWNLYNAVMSADEFASRTCADLNLPAGFQERIALQIIEQVESYQEIMDTIHSYGKYIPDWDKKVSQLQPTTIGIRQGVMDYSDKIDWNPMDADFTPEDFAAITVSDLGLPTEMEPAIAHKIRESLFRWIITILQNPSLTDVTMKPEFAPMDVAKVTLMGTQSTVEMITNLWKRAKPNTLEESVGVPQQPLPADRESNANIWTINGVFNKPVSSAPTASSSLNSTNNKPLPIANNVPSGTTVVAETAVISSNQGNSSKINSIIDLANNNPHNN